MTAAEVRKRGDIGYFGLGEGRGRSERKGEGWAGPGRAGQGRGGLGKYSAAQRKCSAAQRKRSPAQECTKSVA